MANPPSTTPLSISDATAWTGRFLRREWRLIAPVAFTFFALPPLLLQIAVPNWQQIAGDSERMGQWVPWMVPVTLIGLVGGLATSALALVPAISVGEAIGLAARRLWVVLAALLVVMAALLIGLVVLSFVFALTTRSAETLTGIGVLASILAMVGAFARLLPLLPVAIDRTGGAFDTLRDAWTLTKGRFWHLFGASTLLFLAAALATLAARQTIGVVALLIGRALGFEAVAVLLGSILLAGIASAVSAAGYVLVAGLYRQLAGR